MYSFDHPCCFVSCSTEDLIAPHAEPWFAHYRLTIDNVRPLPTRRIDRGHGPRGVTDLPQQGSSSWYVMGKGQAALVTYPGSLGLLCCFVLLFDTYFWKLLFLIVFPYIMYIYIYTCIIISWVHVSSMCSWKIILETKYDSKILNDDQMSIWTGVNTKALLNILQILGVAYGLGIIH